MYTPLNLYHRILSVDFEKGTALVGGDGNMPLSWTSKYDVASFVAYVLTTLPPSKLEWQTFRIEGDRLASLIICSSDFLLT